MLEFLHDNLGTIIVGFGILSVIAGIILLMIIEKRRGRAHSSCGCSCSACPMAEKCHTKQKNK